MDELPRIRSMALVILDLDYEREMPSVLSTAAQDVLRALVKLRENRTSGVVRSTSMDTVLLQNDNTNNWKHSVSYK
jgi:hypothetical protein